MDGTIQEYVLDMAADTKKEPLRVKQYDTNSRQARITLKMGGEPWTIPFGCQIHINVRKTDGTLADATCTRIDEHTVLTPITEQMTAVTGTQLGELYFLGSDGDIKSQTFPVVVYEAVMDQARIESSDDFQSLQDALRDVKISTASADRATQYATEQGDQARDAAQRAEDAADSIQVAVDAAANAKACESNAKNSELAAAQTQQEVTDYVEAQKVAFVGYSKRETDCKYANALTNSVTGEGDVTVEDAWTAPVLGLDVVGKSEQVATTGAQLQPFVDDTITHVGVTLTINNDLVSLLGTATYSGGRNTLKLPDVTLQAGSYTISMSDAINTVTAVTDDANSVLVQGANVKELKFNIVKETSIHIGFNVISGNVYNITGLRIMLNAGDTALPWEPYTGGAPSPSPDYPQDIISVGTVTTGKQLLKYPYSSATMTINGVTFTDNGDGTITANGTATKNAYYYLDNNSGNARDVLGKTVWLSGCPAGGSLQTYVLQWFNYDGSLSAARDFGTGTNFTVSEASADNYNIVIVIMAGVTANNLVFCPMLNVGDTALPWEPYTGGKPSPSVEYPAEVEVTATGAQLLDFEQCLKEWNSKYNQSSGRVYTVIALGTGFQNPISFSDEDIKVTLSGKVRDISGSRYRIELLDISGNLVGRIDKDTKTITGMASKIRLNFTEGGVGEYADIMLNFGETALPWEPYQSTSAAITLTEPLRGIGEYRDRIMRKDGEWGIERWITKLTLDGNEDWVIYGNSSYISFYTRNSCLPVSMNKREGLCEQLRVMTIGGKNLNTIWLGANNKTVYAIDNQFYDDTLEDKGLANWKAHLAESPLEIITYLDAPTWEPLPSATQQALNALTTYAGTTHLTITAGGPPADVTLEYVQDTQKAIEQHDSANRQYTDNQIAAIVAALPTATQAAIVNNQTTKLLQEV